jgi:hypothetical protein
MQHTIGLLKPFHYLLKMENVSVLDYEIYKLRLGFDDTGYTNCYDNHEAIGVYL